MPFNKQIQNINDRMGEIDRQVEVLYQNAVSAIKENGGRTKEIVSLEEQIQSQNPNTTTNGRTKRRRVITKKAHINVQGMEIAVENPKGSVRSGVDEDGKRRGNTP